MAERKLLALALSTTLCLAVATGMATHGLLTDSESLAIEFSGNLAGNTPDAPAPGTTGTTDGDAEGVGSDSGRPSDGAGNAPTGPSDQMGNVPNQSRTDGIANAFAGAGNPPSSASAAVIDGSTVLELRVAPRTT